MTTTPPRIDPRLGAAALRAPAASMVDSRPQAILKLRPRNSFDYRVRYEPQPNWTIHLPTDIFRKIQKILMLSGKIHSSNNFTKN